MPVGRGVWRLDTDGPVRLSLGGVDLESRIEEAVAADPSIVDPNLFVVGRQVPTPHTGGIDLLGLDRDGTIVIVELKRNRTPREVVAQALDYASWARTLGLDDLRDIWSDFAPDDSLSLDDAFSDRFNWQIEDPDGSHRLLIVASELDASTERIVNYLNDAWELPVNVALFGSFTDRDAQYLVRTWLREPDEETDERRVSSRRKQQGPWDGRTWVVNFGDNDVSRSWSDGLRYGFVSAGGGEWYVRTLRNLRIGEVVACVIPSVGYVAVGTVEATVVRIDEAEVEVDGALVPLLDVPLAATDPRRGLDDDDPMQAEHVVRVRWSDCRPIGDAVWEKHMYANQNTVTRLRHPGTVTVLRREFGWPD